MAKQTVLIAGAFSLANGEAASNYVIGLGHALRAARFDVHYLAAGAGPSWIREDFRQFVCHVVRDERQVGEWQRLWGRLFAAERSLITWMEEAPAEDYCAVIAYPRRTCSVGFLLRLRRLCRRKAWRLVTIVVEWHRFVWPGWRALPHEVLGIMDWEVQLRAINRRAGRIIAVSSYLERYYTKAGCGVLRVPPLVDAQAEKWQSRPRLPKSAQGLTLLFSGSWNRDRIDLIVEAIVRLRREGHNVALEFLGCSLDDLTCVRGLQLRLSAAPAGTFRFHGFVPADRVLPTTACADFCVLLRERARWSDACFPSKVSEVQALGVPMLCNLTSDLDQTLKDGENALIVPDVSASALATTVRRALALTAAERERLRQGSLRRAATHYDYRGHVTRLGTFLRAP